MSLRDRLAKARQSLSEKMNVLLKRGPEVDDDFWDELEETLILSDLGAQAASDIVERLRDTATRKALPDAYAVLDLLSETIEDLFCQPEEDLFDTNPVCMLFVGINGAGKTTTVGKLANQALQKGRKPLIGSADTFRAAAIEQLDEWGRRSGVEVVKRERGTDPASVCYDVVERAEACGSDLVLIDTSGRLHTSADLMRELEKVVNVTRKRANMDVKVLLVIDATTGQNGLQQAREFNKALGLDGVIMTKLDGTAKGGIAVAVSHELQLPIVRIGVGEGIEDLQLFDAHAYAQALFGEMRDNDGPEPELEPEAESPEFAEPELEPEAELESEPELEPLPEVEPNPESPEGPEGPAESESAEEAPADPEVEEAVEKEPAEAVLEEDLADGDTADAEGSESEDGEDSTEGEPAESEEKPKKKWWQKLF